MSRSIDDVDLGILICNCGILGKNGDTALTLDISGVHYTLRYFLILSEYTALLQKFINQGGLAVVYMGDNCDISYVFSLSDHYMLLSKP